MWSLAVIASTYIKSKLLSSEQHSITMSMNGLIVTTQLIGLLPVTSYNCCVSAVYELYQADGICDEIETPELFISATTMNQISSRASDYDSETQCHVVGGVIGFIIVILFALLIISGVALVYLLVPRWKRNTIPGAR